MESRTHQLNNREQFEHLFTTYYAELVIYLSRYTREADVAEDIVQEMFCELWDKRETYNIHSNIKAFLFRSARNAALNYLTRVKKITVELSEKLSNETIFQENLEAIEQDRKLYSLIERLPEQRKRIFKMCFFQELKYTEVAEQLQISVNTIKTQMGRALTELRESADELILLFMIKKLKKIQ